MGIKNVLGYGKCVFVQSCLVSYHLPVITVILSSLYRIGS
jgi:hypothetical protein